MDDPMDADSKTLNQRYIDMAEAGATRASEAMSLYLWEKICHFPYFEVCGMIRGEGIPESADDVPERAAYSEGFILSSQDGWDFSESGNYLRRDEADPVHEIHTRRAVLPIFQDLVGAMVKAGLAEEAPDEKYSRSHRLMTKGLRQPSTTAIKAEEQNQPKHGFLYFAPQKNSVQLDYCGGKLTVETNAEFAYFPDAIKHPDVYAKQG